MELTYSAYKQLLLNLLDSNYNIVIYKDINKHEKEVILRHDIDFDLDKAVKMAELEKSLNITSTYFFLLSTDFYNIFSKQSYEKICRIKSLGHEIGLHFDEQRYDISSIDDFRRFVLFEAKILETLLKEPISVVSMHRPSRFTLESNIQFRGLINSYSTFFFENMKYLSDSRLCWKEDIINIVKQGKFKKLHILVHPFSYDENTINTKEKLMRFIDESKIRRYNMIKDNFRNLEEFISINEI